MAIRKTLLGTACIAAAALAAGPAAADTLEGWAGYANAEYTHSTFTDSSGHWNNATVGIGYALPIADIPNLNVEVGASYGHGWSEDYEHFSPNYCNPPASSGPSCPASYSDSAETWHFGFSPFLAYPGSRWGINFDYETITHFGHVTNGGLFMEWYLMDTITLSAKTGYLSSGGTPIGGHGHYLAAGATFYPMPDIAVTGLVDWQDVTTGGASTLNQTIGSVAFGPNGCLHCSLDSAGVYYSLDGEWLPNQDWGVAVYGRFTYAQRNIFKDESNETIWRVGVKYYTGMGDLMNRHRNGTLHSILRGP